MCDSPRDQLLAVPDAVDELFANDDFNGCFFVNVAVQIPLPHVPGHQVAAAHKDSMGAIIRELGGYAGAEEPAAFAQEMSLLMEGAYVTRQVTRDPETGDIARRMINMLVERYLLASR
ncbi:MAG: hypothetical protein IH897_10975 [Planctomycetes bacterium]|nr:hypothetical protein [Planctomycetota bacterium]